jgi:hypothetical protein
MPSFNISLTSLTPFRYQYYAIIAQLHILILLAFSRSNSALSCYSKLYLPPYNKLTFGRQGS